jgi:hypothetical protein
MGGGPRVARQMANFIYTQTRGLITFSPDVCLNYPAAEDNRRYDQGYGRLS